MVSPKAADDAGYPEGEVPQEAPMPSMMRCFGCIGSHMPENGPQKPKTPREWDWSDRSCKQCDILHKSDDVVNARCTMPTPLEITRLVSWCQENLSCKLLCNMF